MKIGLLAPGGARLKAYWSTFLRELGLELAQPHVADAEALSIGAQSLGQESSVVQLSLGRILAFGRVDAVVVVSGVAVSGDAWNEAFTELLPRRISGLPTLIAVPDAGKDIEETATEVGLRLTRNAGMVRRALDKARPLLEATRQEMPPLSHAGLTTVAVIAPRALLSEPLLLGDLAAELSRLGLYPVYSASLPLPEVINRAERMENSAKVPAGERELFGSLSLLLGKSAVRGALLLAPQHDLATRAALGKLGAGAHKPTLLLEVAPGQSEFPELAQFARSLGAVAEAEEAPSA